MPARPSGAVNLPPVSEWTQVQCGRCGAPLQGVGTTRPMLLPPALHTGNERCPDCAALQMEELQQP